MRPTTLRLAVALTGRGTLGALGVLVCALWGRL